MERWRPVPGYEGLYAVSDLGNVRSFHAGRGTGKRGGLLRPGLTAGRLCVALRRDGTSRTRLVHHLVLEAFAGPRPPGLNALHGPGGPLDNRLANLRWGTQRENYAGERAPTAKLTEAAVIECRRRYAAGETQRALAAEFGVNPATISEAVTGRKWGWLPGAVPTDRTRHGRKGERHHAAKLTAAQAAEIRRRAGQEHHGALASEFGVSQASVWRIAEGRTWAHL
jgi:hypothetical protein